MTWLLLGLLLPTPPLQASNVRTVSWPKLQSLSPGTLLWVDLASGERQALRLVRADEQALWVLDLPADWSDQSARQACKAVARQPDARQVEVGSGQHSRRLEVASAARRLERGDVAALARVERHGGRRALGWVLGGVVAFSVFVLTLAAAYGD